MTLKKLIPLLLFVLLIAAACGGGVQDATTDRSDTDDSAPAEVVDETSEDEADDAASEDQTSDGEAGDAETDEDDTDDTEETTSHEAGTEDTALDSAEDAAGAEVVPDNVVDNGDGTSTTSIGPFEVTHPSEWSAIEAQGGSLLIANLNPEEVADSSQIPDDAVIIQYRVFGRSRVTGLDEEPTPTSVLTALTADVADAEGNTPEVTEITRDTFNYARVDVSTPELANIAYAYGLSDESFALVTSSSLDAEGTSLQDAEDTVLDILDSVTMTIETPISEDAQTRYDDLPQSFSEQGFPQLGDEDAPVQLVEIASYDCPACRFFHESVLPDLMPRIEAGELLYIYVPIFGTGGIANGDNAARAAICAGESGEFWSMHDALYTWQDFGQFAYLYERVQQGFVELGLDAEAFNTCYVSEETDTVLQAAFDEARALGDQFAGTPAILVNGVLVPNDVEELNAAIDLAASGDLEAEAEVTEDAASE